MAFSFVSEKRLDLSAFDTSRVENFTLYFIMQLA